MENEFWIPTISQLPLERLVVETKSPNGQVQQLKRIGTLWFFPDDSMYVYYVPSEWRLLNSTG